MSDHPAVPIVTTVGGDSTACVSRRGPGRRSVARYLPAEYFGSFDLILLAMAILSTSIALAVYVKEYQGESHVRLVAEPGQVSLGTVAQVEEVPFHFVLCNQGSHSLVVTELLKPCSCTDVDLPSGTEIGPGSRLDVKGKMRTIGKRGLSNMTILVTYALKGQASAPEFPKISLSIPVLVNVMPAIEVSQNVAWISNSSWTTVTLGRGTAKSFAINGVEVSDPFIQYELVNSRLGEWSDHFQLRLKQDRTKVGDVLDHSHNRDSGKSWIEFRTSESNDPSILLPVKIDGDKVHTH